ncbi:hypothetical protein PanWU01x14_157880 [Parasponia andersonii]|uniref:Uncharacterized protein n=1 Tax=Parasponia andersonii TaxID=3476 RepID=A0A2P5CFA4_PARAD|nr:hypothetical protein PanWU01x14_157880 [Parasponia andersonii]
MGKLKSVHYPNMKAENFNMERPKCRKRNNQWNNDEAADGKLGRATSSNKIHIETKILKKKRKKLKQRKREEKDINTE